MAHSYVSFGDNSVHMHDIEIILTAFYILRYAESHPNEYPEAEYPYLSVWRDVLEVYAPGCLDLELDQYLTRPEGVERFRKLALAARADLAAQGETIPGSRLNEMVDAPELFEFGDRPKAKMLADFDRLLEVVATSQPREV